MDIQHIPAWKRLGLKLKHASEDATTTDLAVRANEIGKKRKQGQVTSVTDATNGLNEPQHQPKKPRVDQHKTPKKLKKEIHDVSSDISKAKVPKRKKSVTFTADTKIDDGESAQTIQFNVPDSPGSTPKKANGIINADEPAASPRKPKREKKPKDQRTAAPAAVPRKATAGLQYLWLFSHQRSAWKFNKNHDTWVLKHALSNEVLPSDHNFALATYLHTLKSEGAKQRLIEQSRGALETGDDIASIDAETEKTLLNSIQQSVGDSTEHSDQLSPFNDLDRSRLILLALGATAESPRSKAQGNSQTQPRVKKNKSRTSRVEIEDSSSSESDSEDSEDEGSGSISKSGIVVNQKQGAPGANTQDTSSSESTAGTSSESSSDSDTDTSDSE